MRGDVTSLKTRLQAYSYHHSTRKVFHVWCQAHRLQLALGSPFSHMAVSYIELILKELASFYHSGHQRWLHLDNLWPKNSKEKVS